MLYIYAMRKRQIKTSMRYYYPLGSDSKECGCSAGDLGSIPGLERSPGEGSGYPLQYSCLENPMNRRAWRFIAHGVAKELGTTEQLTLSLALGWLKSRTLTSGKRMQGNRNSHMLLTGMQNGTVTLEDNLAVSYKQM